MKFLNLFNSGEFRGESCSSYPSGVHPIIKECAEEHEKGTEAAECVNNFLQVSSVAFHETKTYAYVPFLYLQSSSTSTSPINHDCFCQSLSESWVSLYSTSKVFCGLNSCDGLFLDVLGLEERRAPKIFGTLLAIAVHPSTAVILASLISAGATIWAAHISKGNSRVNSNSTVNMEEMYVTHPKCSDFLNGNGGIIDIPETDTTFYTDKLLSIVHSFNEPLAGEELDYLLGLPFKLSSDQSILGCKKLDDQGVKWNTELNFDEVPPQAYVAWSLKTEVKTLKTTRFEVNGNVLCEEVY